jgi:hypothetical protein
MPSYHEYFLSAPPYVYELELLEISHPAFSQTFRVVRNSDHEGVTVTHEDPPGGQFHYEYYPLSLKLMLDNADLEQQIQVTLGDLSTILPNELDRVSDQGYFHVYPTVKYRVYRSDLLSSPIYGPDTFEIRQISFSREGCMFRAQAPATNQSRVGETYTRLRFPMLRGFLEQ